MSFSLAWKRLTPRKIACQLAMRALLGPQLLLVTVVSNGGGGGGGSCERKTCS